MKDAGVPALLLKKSADTHSAGVHEEMEELAVVRSFKYRGRGEKCLEMFEGMLRLFRPLDAPFCTG